VKLFIYLIIILITGTWLRLIILLSHYSVPVILLFIKASIQEHVCTYINT